MAVAAQRRRWPTVLAIVLVLAIGAVYLLSRVYIDLLWFREVGFSSVFWTTIWTRVLMGAIFTGAFFVLLYVNLLLVRRTSPPYRILTPDQQILERYRRLVDPYLRWLLPAASAVVAVVVGIAVSAQWRTFLLWRNASGVSFGTDDPLFGRDISFYVFRLPFVQFVQSWLFSALVAVTVIVAVAHYAWGGIRPQSPAEKVTPYVKAHLSVLLGLIVLTKAWGYALERFDLLVSERGVVTGASYTDVKAQLPALNILTIVAIVCAVLFLVNIRLRGWAFPVIGVGLLLLASLVVGGLIPFLVQKFSVEPQELQRERPYIERNIESSREAFGLDRVTPVQAELADDVPPEAVAANENTIANIRLWDPALLMENFEQLQRIKPYYEFADVDVDRYVLDGNKRVVMLSPREISQAGIPEGGRTWQNQHLFYTHGYGATASLVNGASAQGGPLFVLRDIPPEGMPELADALNAGQPRVYFGELDDARFGVEYVVVNTGSRELDYQGTAEDDQGQVTSVYRGTGGIPVGGWFRRLLFATRFGDVNFLISDLIKPESRVLINKNINARLALAAPFLQFDGDPYAAIVDGRLVWIRDAYTTTDLYPYSERIDLASVTGNQLRGRANYIRNSVKAVVDAYDGSITLYVSDPEDPIIRVWRNAFPDLFTDFSEASPELRAHFRYPENLLQVQAAQYANYHVTDPSVFYQKQDFWAVPIDPTIQANPATGVVPSGVESATMRPYYVLTELPGEREEEFSLILPFVPQGRQNMVAWIAARSDPEHYGEILSFEFPAGRNVDGPVQVFNEINADARFSAERTLLGQQGSQILFGNLLVIPLEDSFLYVQPVFVQGQQENAFPELKRVVVAHGSSIGIGATLAEALEDSGLAPAGGERPDGEPGDEAPDVRRLLDQALRRFEEADAALARGDLAAYQEEIENARRLIRQAESLSEGAGTRTPSPAPSPSPSPAAA